MKITTKVGLVGFLLALSSISVPKAEATTTHSTIESRLERIAKVIREKESQAEAAIEEPDSLYLAGRFLNSGNGVGFINRTPSFRNNFSGWGNNGVTGWRNGGGGSFLNRTPSFRNYNGGWRNNNVSGWRNGGGGGFINRSPNFRNGGSFRNF